MEVSPFSSPDLYLVTISSKKKKKIPFRFILRGRGAPEY